MKDGEKTALVTGSSRGIGRACAVKLAESGIFVYLNYLQNDSAARRTLEEVRDAGGRGALCPFDVSDFEVAGRAVEGIVKDRGGLHILVNNAGVVADRLLVRTGEAEWDRLINTNLKGAFNCCHAASRPMIRQRWGRIVNISSLSAEAGNAGQAAYAASKSGIIGLTKTLARELGAKNICVNAVAPGLIETDMTASLEKERLEIIKGQIPLNRLGVPQDVAGVVAFLVSPQADYITGQIIRVNGGLYM